MRQRSSDLPGLPQDLAKVTFTPTPLVLPDFCSVVIRNPFIKLRQAVNRTRHGAACSLVPPQAARMPAFAQPGHTTTEPNKIKRGTNVPSRRTGWQCWSWCKPSAEEGDQNGKTGEAEGAF